jgi:hypothetical protein
MVLMITYLAVDCWLGELPTCAVEESWRGWRYADSLNRVVKFIYLNMGKNPERWNRLNLR